MRPGDLLDRAVGIARRAAAAGVDAAEAYLARSLEREVRIRGGGIERAMESGSLGAGLRVDRGARQGFASTTDLSEQGIADLIAAARAVLERAPEDPGASIPEPTDGEAVDLDLSDPELERLDLEAAIRLARRVEAAALTLDPRVQPGEGSAFDQGEGTVAVASTRGLARAYSGTRVTLASFPVAEGHDGERQRQSWFESRRHIADLPQPEEVGRRAGERAVRMLGARSIASRRASVVFDPIEGARFWAGLAPALLGDTARRGVSFLASDLGRAVAAEGVTLADDPRIPRAPGSRPFDGEGTTTARRLVIDRGVLSGFLWDTRTARRAGVRSTGNAVRGYAGLPQPGAHALILAPGRHTSEGILGAAGRGLFVTHLIGFGVDLATGGWSRGANGWWFEDGAFAYPVHGVTLSGNLREMLRRITMVGQDLVHRTAASSPTFLMEDVVLSGGVADGGRPAA